MAGRVNHRGWIVLESIASADGGLCVDFFENPAGGYGFEHFRADSEDRGRWTAVGGFGHRRFGSAEEAAAAAGVEVEWLTAERRPRESLDLWIRYLRSRPRPS